MTRRVFLKRASMLAMPLLCTSAARVVAATASDPSFPQSAAEAAAGIEPVHDHHPPGNVMRYGAVGDGSTDDTSAINKALLVASEVYFPPGTFMVRAHGPTQTGFNKGTEAGLVPRSNQRLTFDKRAILKAIPNGSTRSNVIRCREISNVIIEGATIHGDRATHSGRSGEWGHGIGIWHCKDITIRDCVIADCWGDGIFVDEVSGAASKNIAIVRVRCTNNRRNGCSIVSAENVRVSDSTFDSQTGTDPQAGFWIEPDVTKSVSSVFVSNCDFFDNAGEACGASLVHGVSVTKVTFDSCTARNCEYGFVLRDVFDSHISNCVATGAALYGMQLQNAVRVEVANCICFDNDRDGLRISDASSDFSVTASEFYRNGTTTSGNGLVIVANAAETRIPTRGFVSSCTFHENSINGINITTATEIKVIGCLFVGNGQSSNATHSNIRISKVNTVHAADIVIRESTFRAGVRDVQPRYHIQISAGDNCRVCGNDFSDPAANTSISISAGRGNRIESGADCLAQTAGTGGS